MKHNMNRVLSIVALLMLTIGSWAQTAEDVTVTVLPNANAGTVFEPIVDNDGVCTLTVTPAAGYYLNPGNVTAVATLKGEAMQAPRRNLPINEGVLEVTQNATDASKYSFTIPENCQVEVTVEFYAGVTFDATTNTLTLNNVNITPVSGEWAFEFGQNVDALIVNLQGENVIRGNAFRFANSKPALVFTTDEFYPGSLLIGPFTEAPTPYSLISPKVGENGASVYYENGLAVAEADQHIVIGGQAIVLKVGDVTVTSANAADILGDGKVSFNAQSKTLTLNNVTINSLIESNIDSLKVLLIGTNTLGTSTYGFKYTGTFNEPALTFEHEANGFGSLTISGGTLANGYAYNNQETGWVVTENSVSYVENYLTIGDVSITSANLSHTSGNGTASYNRLTNTLSLNKYTTTANITSNVADLTISLTGVNSVGTITYSGANAGKLTINRNNAANELLNELTVTSINNYAVTLSDPLTQTNNVYSDVRRYNLWVNGDQVTSKNMDAIATDISFDGDHTLTFNGVNATASDVPFITNGLSKLTIVLVGTNAVDCGQQVFLAKKEGDIDHQVTFTTDANAVGKLTVKVSESNSWYTGHSKVTLLNKLQEDSKVLDMVKTVTIEAPTAEYGLSVNGVALTNLNANDVFKDGSVKYDATTNVLTLKKAQLEGDIISDIDELFIQLHGDCKVNAFDRTVGSQGKLKFSLGGDQGGLKLNFAIPTAKFDVTTADRLTFDEDKKVLALPTSYGITVAGINIDSENRLHVLGVGNESVIFDNNAQLILNKATINGEIVVENASSLPDNTLTINLSGQNTINLDNTQKAIKCNEGTLTLVITLADKTASLAINNDVNEITKDNVFSGVTSTYDGLSVLNKPGNHLLMITTLLPPVVNQEGQTAETDFKNDMNPGTNTNNQNIKGVLYTMGDEKSDKDNSSGYDQTQGALVFVGAAAMTEEKLQQVLEEQPGTQTYADRFTGLTFGLPAGSSIIKIASYISDPDYAFYIQVGDQEPVEVESGFGNTSAAMALTSLKIVVGQAGIVKLFMMKKPKTTGAPQMDMANRRIGPKSSVAGGLGGISIRSHAQLYSTGPADTYKAMEKSSLTKAISMVAEVSDGYSCSDPNISDLPDDLFVDNGSNAPRRAGTLMAGTILPEGLTFVDFSNTKITGMEVSRSSGAFNKVPENVFIYMPAGNTTKEKNVVIGGICDKMELNGGVDAQPFKAKNNFTAAQVTLKRTFEAGSADSKATIYLPYAITQEDANKLGTFYEFKGINDQNEVQMTKVTTGGLKANKPYIFEAKEGGVVDPLVRVADVVALPAETEGFKGVYERKEYEDGMYCYAAEAGTNNAKGQFVEMGPGSYVPPFRAYMIGNGAPSYAIAWDGVVDMNTDEENTTAVETVKAVADKKVAEGWWTLNGVRLNGQPKKAGLYVKDGKLVVIK